MSELYENPNRIFSCYFPIGKHLFASDVFYGFLKTESVNSLSTNSSKSTDNRHRLGHQDVIQMMSHKNTFKGQSLTKGAIKQQQQRQLTNAMSLTETVHISGMISTSIREMKHQNMKRKERLGGNYFFLILLHLLALWARNISSLFKNINLTKNDIEIFLVFWISKPLIDRRFFHIYCILVDNKITVTKKNNGWS